MTLVKVGFGPFPPLPPLAMAWPIGLPSPRVSFLAESLLVGSLLARGTVRKSHLLLEDPDEI